MPFVSKKQARFAHANPEQFGGEEGLKEWDESTDFGALPNKVAKKPQRWMQAESNREEKAGTKGVFSAAAARAGKSTAEFAEEHLHSPGKIGKRARLAKAFMSAKH